MKRVLTAILATLMILSLCACTGGGETDGGLEKGTVIKITVPSSPSWPFREDWKVWDYIEEASGAILDIQSFPTTDASTKYSLIFASPETVPDVAVFTGNMAPLRYARQGALIAFDDLISEMPAYSAWLDGLSEEAYNLSVKTRKAADGKIYYTPVTGRDGASRMRCWMYREDIFEKHDLKVPTTFDELYEVLKRLKTLYPDSYPYIVRGNFDTFNVVGSSFDKWWQVEMYYDYDDGEWRWGATEDTMKEVILYYRKLIAEELMPPNFFNLSVSGWEEKVTAAALQPVSSARRRHCASSA
jgi:putative aldouronate transport system substrate-binding protein